MKAQNKIKFYKSALLKKIVVKFLYLLFGIAVLYNVLYLINTSITKKQNLEIFGINLFSMETDAMKGKINKNDLVIAKSTNSNRLQENDTIAYYINDTLRISTIINYYYNNAEERLYFTTKAYNNYYPDQEPVCETQVVGRVITNIPVLGLVIKILQSKITSGFMIFVMCIVFYYNRHKYQMQRQRNRKKKVMEI